MSALFKREFKAYFNSPIGYLALIFLFFVTGYMFTTMYANGYPYMDYLFSSSSIFAAFIIPIITMRLFSEERRNKTDQALLTAPVKIFDVVMGKYLAAMALFAIGFAPTAIFQTVISFYVSSNWLIYLSCLLGVLLFGGALIAIGCFVSSVTESQAVAAILGIVATIILLMAEMLVSMITAGWMKPVINIVSKYSIAGKMLVFTQGIISLGSVVYFLSLIALFLFFTVMSLNKRRWK